MKRIKIGKVILIIFLSLVIVGISYVGSFYIDKLYKYNGNAKIKVVFDDTETYKIPNVLVSDKEKALSSWPYMFTITNEGNRKGLYQLIIKDIDTSTISRDKLDYVLVLDDKEIQEGSLSDIENDILYTYEIKKNTSQRYKIYIWSKSEDTKNDDIYEYQITLNAIEDFGPGF